ncbi:hypothetical protein MOD13_03825, partial [Bacillus vallismortis]|uniref:hypothetical protein n=1 Tax=Bacillus vallismortis TaxID=72361 RepID=UPI002280C4D1
NRFMTLSTIWDGLANRHFAISENLLSCNVHCGSAGANSCLLVEKWINLTASVHSDGGYCFLINPTVAIIT